MTKVPSMRSGWVAGLLVVVGLMSWLSISGYGENPADERVSNASTDRVIRHSEPLAAQSCSNAACHGRLTPESDPQRIRFDEFAVWTTDPHCQAFATLHGDRSTRIFQNLGLLDERGALVAGAEQQFQDHWQNCRGCHDTGHQGASANGETGSLSEGVSCGACHGSADEWVHRHSRSTWKQLSTAEKAAYGYQDLNDLTLQATVCSSCHVGHEAGEVTHDLIAAGHPALKFEFVWYHHRMPRHWNPERTSSPPAPRADSSEAWLIGQRAAAGAALRQLERRTQAVNDGHPDGVWPELSEYGCFACHHDLEGTEPWRATRGFTTQGDDGSNLPKVLIPWQPWELELLPHLAAEFNTEQSSEFHRACVELQRGMASGFSPDAGEIARLAAQASAALENWGGETERITSRQVDRALASLVSEHNPDWCVSTWERSTHLFLALAARHRGGSASIPQGIFELGDLLRFPTQGPARFDSPQQFVGPANPQDSRHQNQTRQKAMRQIHELLR